MLLQVALKGQRATEELATARPLLAQWGADADATVITCGATWLTEPIQVVSATRRR